MAAQSGSGYRPILWTVFVAVLIQVPLLYFLKKDWLLDYKDWLPSVYVGVLYTVVVGAATFVLALIISEKQNQLQQRVMDRIFGTMSEFDDVYHQVIRLINDTNEREDSKLAIMVYWLWFGVDRRLQREPEVDINKINPNDSEFRVLLEYRRLKGRDTTIVVYHPTDASQDLHRFVKAAFNWQLKNLPPRSSGAKREIKTNDVNLLLQRYTKDLEDFEKRRIETTKTRFEPLRLRGVIPMLMFAARDRRSNWCRGVIYLGETEPLEKRAKTGGFLSEDPQIVDVIFSQILTIQSAATSAENETPPAGVQE